MNPEAGEYNWKVAFKALAIFLVIGLAISFLVASYGTSPFWLVFGVPVGLAVVIWLLTLIFFYSEKGDTITK